MKNCLYKQTAYSYIQPFHLQIVNSVISELKTVVLLDKAKASLHRCKRKLRRLLGSAAVDQNLITVSNSMQPPLEGKKIKLWATDKKGTGHIQRKTNTKYQFWERGRTKVFLLKTQVMLTSQQPKITIPSNSLRYSCLTATEKFSLPYISKLEYKYSPPCNNTGDASKETV